MAETAAVRIVNIVSVTHNNTYEGVREVQYEANYGENLPILVEGKLYPSGLENVGTPGFPVSGRVVFEQDCVNMLLLLASATASLVIVAKKAAGAGNETITIANVTFTRLSMALNLQGIARPSVEFVAYSADGTAFPVS
jgi:hypothetical protein